MSEINTLKLQSLNEGRKKTQREVSNLISQLHSAADTAMTQQAYMHKNPDANGADQLIPIVHPAFVEIALEFNKAAEKLSDMQKLSNGEITVEELIAKYSIDLSEFSNGLA